MEEFTFTDENGQSYHDYREYVFTELLGYCGCWDGGLYDDIFIVLKAYYDADKNDLSLYYNDLLPSDPRKYIELILHDLTRADILEHGTAVRGSWLTDKGKKIVKKLFDN